MIKEELVNNNELIKHYSSDGKTILQIETGIEYLEAVDVIPCKYTYEETEHTLDTIQTNE